MTEPTKTSKGAATQDFVSIDEIREGAIILKSGGFRSVLMCTSMNFELKSADEQEAIIGAYQGFVNSFDWPMQFVIHSRKLDVKPYLAMLDEKLSAQENELLKIQTAEYIDFIRNFVSLSNIMTKTFYAIVPFDPVESKKAGPFERVGTIFGTKPKGAEILPEETFREYKSQLLQRVDHVISGLAHVGIRAVPLTTEELIELFYNLYNPEELETKNLAIAKELGAQR